MFSWRLLQLLPYTKTYFKLHVEYQKVYNVSSLQDEMFQDCFSVMQRRVLNIRR